MLYYIITKAHILYKVIDNILNEITSTNGQHYSCEELLCTQSIYFLNDLHKYIEQFSYNKLDVNQFLQLIISIN